MADKVLKIRYTIQSGNLPNGMALNPDTGVISGAPGWDALGLGPTWTGPAAGSVGAYDEGATITSVQFATTSNKGPVVYSLASDQQRLPWGLSFNPQTGILSGTLAPLKQRVKEQGSTSDGPAWSTSFGKVAGYDEMATASVQLTAVPIGSRTMKAYQVVDGALPWGLKLNAQTGVISGVVAPLKNPGPFVDVPKLPVPVWTNNQNLATIDEYQSFTATLIATPGTGRSMNRYIITKGALPFGLKLNQNNGVISGTTAEMVALSDNYIDPTLANTLVSTVTLSPGGAVELPNGGTLGSYAKGSTVSATFTTNNTAGSNLTTQSYFIASGTLPRGLTLSKTGVIQGTIKNDLLTKSGTYTFSIGVSTRRSDYPMRLNISTPITYTITVQ